MIAENPTKGPDGWSHTGVLLADTPFWASLIVASADNGTISGIRPMCGPFLITHGSFPATCASGGRITRSRHRPHHCCDRLSICRPFTPLLNHCCAISAASSRDPCCLPASSPQFQASILILACLHFQPPMGVTRNSILILITPGGMVLDHPLFVGSLFARCSMAGVGKSGCAGGLLDGLKGRTGARI